MKTRDLIYLILPLTLVFLFSVNSGMNTSCSFWEMVRSFTSNFSLGELSVLALFFVMLIAVVILGQIPAPSFEPSPPSKRFLATFAVLGASITGYVAGVSDATLCSPESKAICSATSVNLTWFVLGALAGGAVFFVSAPYFLTTLKKAAYNAVRLREKGSDPE